MACCSNENFARATEHRTTVRPMAYSMHVKFEIKMNWKWKLIVFGISSSLRTFVSVLHLSRLFHYIYIGIGGIRKKKKNIGRLSGTTSAGVTMACSTCACSNFLTTENAPTTSTATSFICIHIYSICSFCVRLNFAVCPKAPLRH